MTIRNPAIASIVKRMSDNFDVDQIEATLISLGVTPCVAREWANESSKHTAIATRRLARAQRKRESKYGLKRADYRRIILTKVGKRDRHYHATKGWRSYRRAV